MRLSSRVLKLLRESAARRAREPIPVRLRRAIRPMLGTLEPRVVLNATAELNSLGQLVISGSEVADVVSLETNASDQILIRDGAGSIIPIVGNPGNDTDPLSRSAITSNQLIIDLLGGDDTLTLQIPAGISVEVLKSAGTDSTTLGINSPLVSSSSQSLSIDSENLQIQATQTLLDLRSTNATFTGSVSIGDANTVTNVLLDQGSLAVIGNFTLQGDVNINGPQAQVDLSKAVLSANTLGHDLRLTLGSTPGNDLRFGESNDSSGAFVRDVIIDSARDVSFEANSFQITGQLDVSSTETFESVSGIQARQVNLDTRGSLTIEGVVITDSGEIKLHSDQAISIAGTLDSSSTSQRDITIDAPVLEFDDLRVITRGGQVSVEGATLLRGTLDIDTGANRLASTSGNVILRGSINAADSSEIRVDTRGVTSRAAILVSATIGETSQPNQVTFTGGIVEVANVDIGRGNLTIDALGTNARGDRLTSLGNISIVGPLSVLSPSLGLTGQNVLLAGVVSGQSNSGEPLTAQTVRITASNDVTVQSGVVQLTDLFIDAEGTATLHGPVALRGELFVDGTQPTVVSSPSITTGSKQTFIGGLDFVNNGFLSASSVDLGGNVSVASGVTFVVNAPVAGLSLQKLGAGTLTLSEANLYTGATLVEQGTLRINGSTAVGAQPIQLNGGRLEGTGVIQSRVISQNNSQIGPGPTFASLTVAGIDLSASTLIDVQIQGPTAGTQHDQLIVRSGNDNSMVNLGGAELRFSFETTAQAATEYILVRNEGTAAINGLFSTRLSTSGTFGQELRILNEGSLVANNFGGSGRPAYITYRGGDGNDVAIVTAGDVSVTAGPTTLIQRRGSNLEIRTGADRPSAESALPTIRPIAALNDYQVLIRGSVASEQLLVDMDGWIDPTLAAIQFTGTILFDGGGTQDSDSISLLDFNPATDDLPRAISYSINNDRSGSAIVTAARLPSQFRVMFTQTESFAQELSIGDTTFRFSALDESITLVRDTAAPSRTQIQSTSAEGTSTAISFANPSSRLSIEGGDGRDEIRIDGTGTGFYSAIHLDGQAGDDRIDVNTALNLGQANVIGNFEASAETITIAADITTRSGMMSGSVSLTGGTQITLLSDASVHSGTAGISINANSGAFNAAAGTLVSVNQDTAISIHNASQVLVGDVVVANGGLAIETSSPNGTITQADNTRVVANRLRVDAVGDLVFANANNEFTVIECIDSTSNVRLNDSAGNLLVSHIKSAGEVISLATIGDLSVANRGISANEARVTLTAGGSILDSRSSIDPANANIEARQLELFAGQAATGAAIGTPSNSLVVEISESLTADTSTSNGNIFIASPLKSLPIGRINAGSGTVTLNALAIDDAESDELADISAQVIRMDAAEGIGVGRRLELSNTTRLLATTDQGGIDVLHRSSQPFTLERISSQAGDIRISHTGSSPMMIERVVSGSGSVFLTNEAGDVSVNAVDANPAIEIKGLGNLQLQANGVQADVLVQDSISTFAGNISLIADRNVNITSGMITSTRGNLLVAADDRDGNHLGTITMAAGTKLVTGDGQVQLTTDGNIQVAAVETQSTNDRAIVVQSHSGAVLGSSSDAIHLASARGGAQLLAMTGIGRDIALRTNLASLEANVSGTGLISIDELSAIDLKAVSTADGSIRVAAAGTITATKVTSLNLGRLDDPRGDGTTNRDITLISRGDKSDLLIGEIEAMNDADVSLVSGDDVLRTIGVTTVNVIADDLRIVAFNQDDSAIVAVDLAVNVSDLAIQVNGRNRGDIQIREQDTIRLASSDSGSDDDVIQTTNGLISIEALNSILVSDADSTNDGLNLKADAEIIAGGVNGRVKLIAAKTLELAGTVEIVADSAARHSLILEANQVAFGNQIELRTGTGNDGGIARWFSPRPQPGLADTAFFDFTTITTNRLAQAGANDATGILTMVIGKQGEKGLVIDIDWGAQSNRISRILGLDGAQNYDFTHVYTEADILDSVLNGRTSATEPLQVRFAVSHHDSILVRGTSVTQVVGLREEVPGNLVSSTDPDLPVARGETLVASEPFVNGTATFIIPNLTIPVAFFPVRQIIPDTIRPEVFVRVETSQFFASSTVESKSSVSSATVSRDEFFQIRVLSLEPGGEDLAAPQPLPADILEGDNLKRLFAELPDGRYEVQYVLGDGNERTLLRVDVRSGETVLPGDEREGGKIQLKEVDLDELRKEMDEVQRESEQRRLQSNSLHHPVDAPETIDDVFSLPAEPEQAYWQQESKSHALAAGTMLLTAVARRRLRTQVNAPETSRFSSVGRFLRRRLRPR